MSARPASKEFGVPKGTQSTSQTGNSKILNSLSQEKGTSKSSATSQKLTVIREKTKAVSGEFKSQVGLSAEEVSELSPTIDGFFDTVAAERLRRMPHNGSKLDMAFRGASQLAFTVNSLRESVGAFALYTDEAAMLIWGSLVLLLEMGVDQADILEKICAKFSRAAIGISLLLQYQHLFTATSTIQSEVAHVYADLLDLVASVTVDSGKGSRGGKDSLRGYHVDSTFRAYFKAFSSRRTHILELMWRTWGEGREGAPEVSTVRQFLEVQDRTLQTMLEGETSSRAEESFEWFDSYLTGFTTTKNHLLHITGSPGSGKSVLADWIIERLQTSGDHADWDVIPYSIRADIPATTSSLGALKSLVLQSLDRCVGDFGILDAIWNAAQLSANGADESKVEDALWKALRMPLKSASPVMFVIDGVDGLDGGHTAAATFMTRLLGVISEYSSVKAIVLSRPLEKVPSGKVQHFGLADTHVLSDMRSAVYNMIRSSSQFNDVRGDRLSTLVDRIVINSGGSFLWAELTVDYLKRQKSEHEMTSWLQTAPKTLSDNLDKHFEHIDVSQYETRCLLAWLLVSQRPLLIDEVRQLLDVEVKANKSTSRLPGSENQLLASVQPLIVERDGVVSFKHPIIKQHFVGVASNVQDYSNTGKFPFHLKEAHYDLLTRTLAWVKTHIYEEVALSFDAMEVNKQNEFFDSYSLLEYAARYGTTHLRSSPLVSSNGEYKFSSSFKNAVPDSVLLALLEGSVHETQSTAYHAVQDHRLSVEVRKFVLGDKAEALLQSLILSARASLRVRAPHASEHCYEAWRLGRELLGRSSSIVIACAELFLYSTDGKFSTRNETVTRKEEVLKYLIWVGQDAGGFSYNHTLTYVEMLVQLYTDIGENDNALSLSKAFYQRTIAKYGQQSSEAALITAFMEKRFPASRDGAFLDIAQSKHDYLTRTLDVTDPRRLESTLAMVKMYEDRGDKERAEGTLVSLWQALLASEVNSTSMLETKTDVALAYSGFLRRQGRNTEGEVILRTVWPDIEKSGIHSDGMYQRTLKVDSQLRDMQKDDLALPASLLVWNYYKRTGQTTSTQGVALAGTLLETLHRGVLSSRTDKTTSGTTATVTAQERQLMRELVDSIVSSSSHISTSALEITHMLTSIYIKEENWQEAIKFSSSVMKRIWPSVEKEGSSTSFKSEIAPHVVEIALDLAYSYFRTLQISKATAVYGNAATATITTEKVVVPRMMEVMTTIVEFYETTFQFPKAVSLLHRIHGFLKSRLGETHKYTLECLYMLADLSTRIGRRDEAERSYREIWLAGVHENKADANTFKAASTLCTMYEEDENWGSALEMYRYLWPLALSQSQSDKPDSAVVEKTYSNYSHVLEEKVKDNVEELYQVTADYRSAAMKLYGGRNDKTLRATLRLADICQLSGTRDDQAIALYEEAITGKKGIPTGSTQQPSSLQTLLTNAKHALALLYVRNKTTSTKAIPLYQEELQLSREQLGHASHTTLGWLRELAILYSRQGSQDYALKATDLLHGYVFEILEYESNAQKLQEAARYIAQIYLDCGYTTAAHKVLDELRSRIIYGSKVTPKLSVDRAYAVFLVAFGEVITQDGTYSNVMEELMNELLLHESFSKSLSSSGDFVSTLASGARLRQFQTEKSQTQSAKDTDAKLFEYFCGGVAASSVASKDIVQQFYNLCLREINHENYDVRIIESSTDTIRNLCDRSRFQDAYDLSVLLHSFVLRTSGLRTVESILSGIRACLYLSGHHTKKCPDRKMYNTMAAQSKVLLQDIIAASRTLGVQFSELPFSQINDLVTLLGEQENFEELEEILTDLWTSRIVQKTWSPDIVVWIGRRLVETRFCRGNTQGAIHLCRDICYNLQHVWGHNDKTTLEMNKLLSSLYTASNDPRSAMELHETALSELLNDSDAQSDPHAAEAAAQHIQLLNSAQQRHGKWDKEPELYRNLISRVTDRFGLKQTQAQSTGKGTASEDYGVWRRPGSFSLDVTDQSQHQNHLRRTSGAGLLGGFSLRRTSIPAM
ncbi:hypothetical protein Plec18167_005845 [Paecilomyces lecythidis]|uniref:Nephrocystin 3-like N-terminal domain-containing protein n=1 Tax=Paecilomyces lecythidis TaxID=3004212 RepID=A0ABR3XF91_9EURO